MPKFPSWPGEGSGRRSKRRVYDESESVISEADSSVVSSISMGTQRNQSAVMQSSDVEGGVPVKQAVEPDPLERKPTKDYSEPQRPSFKQRLLSSKQRLSSSLQSLASSRPSLSSVGNRCTPCWQSFTSLCRNNKKWLAIGGIGVLLIVIVVTISVTVTGRDTNTETTPVPERDQALMNIFSTVSTSESLSDPNSPQYQAAKWMIDDDPLVLTPSIITTNERVIQRYALAVFYFATGGPESWNPNSWMLGNECSGQFWIGLSCNDNDEVRSMAFGKSSGILSRCAFMLVLTSVSSCSLDNFGLSGFIPPEIGELTKLENLILKNHPRLGGEIPGSIGQLSVLGQLGLYDNSLTGGIPNELYGATRLNYINLQNNQLEGGLSIGIEKMTNLEKIILFDNFFSGGLPFQQFGRTKLKFLGVSNNGFSGTIPDTVSMMSRLEYIYLDGNEFSGLLPDNLGRMSSLSKLRSPNFTPVLIVD